MSQMVLADLVERTVDWVSKVENDRIHLDRLSVIARLAEALDVTVGALVGEPSLLEWSGGTGARAVPLLRDVLLDYRQITPLPGHARSDQLPLLDDLKRDLNQVMDAYHPTRSTATRSCMSSTAAC